MDWRGRQAVAAIVVLFNVYNVRSQCLTHLNCPDPLQTAMVKSSSANTAIGGLFSNSRLDEDHDVIMTFCTRCQAASVLYNTSVQQHRFAVEQAEALLYAVEVIEKELGYPVDYSIMDTCGFNQQEETAAGCLESQVRRLIQSGEFFAPLLATIVGPYYSKGLLLQSLLKEDFGRLLQVLAANSPGPSSTSTGMLSLLDLPFWDYQNEATARFVMLQQACELQALAAVDFMAQEGWGTVTVVASGDACGGKSLLEVHSHIQRKRMECHFNVCHGYRVL